MSDTENITENPADQSASATPTPTPKATPKGKGRGRGRKRAANKKTAAAATIVAPKKAVGGRRGRTKQFDDDKVQAYYERQRELKAYYNELSQFIKPMLVELAEREVEALKTDRDFHKRAPEYQEVRDQLKKRLEHQNHLSENRRRYDVENEIKQNQEIIAALHTIYKNNYEDAEDRFLDAQIRCLDLLEELHDKDLPVDTVDESYNYKPITDKEANDFGPYEVWHNGHLVPYPQLVEGTEAYALRQAAHARPATPTKPKSRTAPKAQPKRKAKDQPDGQPAAKKGSQNTESEDRQPSADTPAAEVAPVQQHTQGLLSAQPNTNAAASEDQSGESTPAPDEAATGPIPLKDRDPPLPPFASEPDEYGCRQVNRIPTKTEIERGKIIHNRIIVPPSWELDPIEIGYKDSTNDPTRAATLAKRGKYLGKNGTNTWHYDPMLARHDARTIREEDMDQELVQRHRVHPRYGYFLPRSKNDAEEPRPVVAGDNPIVYITPEGQTIHASRTMLPSKVSKAIEEKQMQRRVAASLYAICAAEGIDAKEIETPEIRSRIAQRERTTSTEPQEQPEMEPPSEAVLASEAVPSSEAAPSPEAVPSPETMPPSRATTPSEPIATSGAVPRDEVSAAFVPANDSAANAAAVASLLDAALSSEPRPELKPELKPAPIPTPAAAPPPVPVVPPAPVSAPVSAVAPAPARPATRSYDAIRDMVIEHAPPVRPPPKAPGTLNLSILADVCSSSPQPSGQSSKLLRDEDPLVAVGPAKKRPCFPHAAEDSSLRSTIQSDNLPGLREPPVQKRTPSFTVPSVEDLALKPTTYHDAPHNGVENPTRARTRHTRVSAAFAEQAPARPPMHPHDLTPARPTEISTMRPAYTGSPRVQYPAMEPRAEVSHRAPTHPEPYPMAYSHHHNSLPPLRTRPSHTQVSRMPFANPHHAHGPPSLPPLRPHPHQSFADTSNGYYGHGMSRIGHDNTPTRPQPGMGHPFSTMTPGGPAVPAPSPYSAYASPQPLASPYAPIAPCPAQGAPSMMPFAAQSMNPNPDYGSPIRPRTGSAASTPGNGRYRELAPAPLPAHRQGQQQAQELRTVQYVPGENIKDYTPTEQPPARGPQVVRSWNQYSHKSNRSLGGQERRESN
ncbi:hypothetical protein SODALDRAFT_95085 [Sodiomyces alkalinus F11]|uniref:Uncharacterized protein n=1 Tax=Sodiomyces alkalinus (strain CBS 110278 / VKM F-3762 / F11) TaxID=1314773 RepID=A0A3N2Q0W0_SODAK|nr:hypothetical protein SODALDRAFT_95085 [Sodiomyces alkalinus F11]ROT40370.1 hypothetical protein SODALDRAFT_95085 [Sodiomyces alkalinus F11]